MMDDKSRAQNLGGTAVVGAMVAGFAALVLAFVSTLSNQFEAGAVALLAAGVSFGAAANAIFRH